MNELTLLEINKKSDKYFVVHSGKEEFKFYADALKIGEGIAAQRLQASISDDDGMQKLLEYMVTQLERRCVSDKQKKFVTPDWVSDHFGMNDIQRTIELLTTGKVSDPK